jgi:hypothetical protein
MDRERVARLRPLNIERASQRIGSRGFYPGIFQRVAISVDRIRFQNIARLQSQHGSSDPIVILKLAQLELIASDMRLLRQHWEHRRGKSGKNKNEWRYDAIHDFS